MIVPDLHIQTYVYLCNVKYDTRDACLRRIDRSIDAHCASTRARARDDTAEDEGDGWNPRGCRGGD